MGANLINLFLQNRLENGMEAVPCKNCPGGKMFRKFSTYFTWMGDELVAVPDFPLWQCDVCKHCEYDIQARQYLKTTFTRGHQKNFSGFVQLYKVHPLSK